MQSDPIGSLGGPSTYGYANGSPGVFADPLGLYVRGGFLTSVDVTCTLDPKFCAEILGDISRSEGTIREKLGEHCASAGTDAAVGIFDALADMAQAAQLIQPLPKNTAIESDIAGVMPWSSKSVRDATKLLESGAKEVQVASRSEAEELFLGQYQANGYRNTIGMSPVETKRIFGSKKWHISLG